jgi:hypothetical protein
MRGVNISMCGFVLVMIGGAGCLDAAPGSTGRVTVPLVASGADGASYRLQPGTRLLLNAPSYSREIPLDGDGPSITVDVPPGDYHPFVRDNLGRTTAFPLDRIAADGTVTLVEGTLELPAPFTVAAGETTAVTLRFHVAVSEVITFTLGAVAVDVAITETTATAYRIELAGLELDLEVDAPVSVLPELAPRHDVVITAVTGAAWRIADPTTACATATVSWQTNLDQVDVFEEAIDEAVPHELCITQFGPGFARIALALTRLGPPRSSLLARFSAVRVTTVFSLDVAADVFDGTTLRLAALATIQPAAVGLGVNFESQLEDGAFQQLTRLREAGGGHAQLTAL